jgi:pyruvate kinase
MKKTKIICTIGPASQDVDTLTTMVKSGMNVARLNFSHGSYDEHAAFMQSIRAVSKKLNVPVAIMQDLQGPKIRIGELVKPVEIESGQTIVIGKDFPLDFDISDSVKSGDRILIEDGLLELQVSKIIGKDIQCKVINGGLVQSHKGINIPDSSVKFPIITKKDERDLKFGLENDVDYVAISFVRGKEDILNLKKLIAKYNPAKNEVPLVIAKIEKPEAIRNFDDILAVTDAVMVARGDLGVELADREVPILQKDIIAKCLKAGKPVIVATQMLDSMIRNPRPTRAEVSDVANAVIDGADCVMLSGESAFGKYPINAVKEMNNIIVTAEQSSYAKHAAIMAVSKSLQTEVMPKLIYHVLHHVAAKVIVGSVDNFSMATGISHTRPFSSLLFYTKKPKLFRQLSLIWGVTQGNHSAFKNIEELEKTAAIEIRTKKLGEKGDEIIVLKSDKKGGAFRTIEMHTV